MTTAESPRRALGLAGEEAAARYLEAGGYRILQRGFRTRMGEIDIIARREGMLVFVEVKARSGTTFGIPAEAVGWRKQTRMTRAAAAWLANRAGNAVAGRPRSEPICRFDVIGVTWDAQGRPRIDHIQDAFRV